MARQSWPMAGDSLLEGAGSPQPAVHSTAHLPAQQGSLEGQVREKARVLRSGSPAMSPQDQGGTEARPQPSAPLPERSLL